MTAYYKKALLPAGFHDLLAEEAAFCEMLTCRLTECFQGYGYNYVNPPLIEFETSLLAGQGKALADQTFRLMDPHSHRMMGVRPDITMQIVRIATARLKNSPLPIRLSYAGPVLRVKGTYLYGERQLTQAGLELIGANDAIHASAEVIIVALDALKQIGVTDVSVDFNLPGFTPILLSHTNLEEEDKQLLQQALNKKDAAQVMALAGKDASLLLALLTPTGDATTTLSLIIEADLPEEAKLLARNLAQVLALVKDATPTVTLTVDPLEYRGFEYHAGIGFSLFAKSLSAEVGRGGSYPIEAIEVHENAPHEAVGVTIDINALLRILPPPERKKHIYIPFGTPYQISNRFRAEGFVTVHGLKKETNPKEEALHMQCDAVYLDGIITDIA